MPLGARRWDNARRWVANRIRTLEVSTPRLPQTAAFISSDKHGSFWPFVKCTRWTHILLDNFKLLLSAVSGSDHSGETMCVTKETAEHGTPRFLIRKNLKGRTARGLLWTPAARCCVRSPTVTVLTSPSGARRGPRAFWTDLPSQIPTAEPSRDPGTSVCPGRTGQHYWL